MVPGLAPGPSGRFENLSYVIAARSFPKLVSAATAEAPEPWAEADSGG